MVMDLKKKKLKEEKMRTKFFMLDHLEKSEMKFMCASGENAGIYIPIV